MSVWMFGDRTSHCRRELVHTKVPRTTPAKADHGRENEREQFDIRRRPRSLFPGTNWNRRTRLRWAAGLPAAARSRRAEVPPALPCRIKGSSESSSSFDGVRRNFDLGTLSRSSSRSATLAPQTGSKVVPKLLTRQQVENFARHGFVSPVRVLSAAEAAECRRELETMEASMGGDLRGPVRTKFYLRYPWAYRLATQKTILDAVEDLIGPDILLYQNTAWAKNAGDDSYVSWHQDNTYFGHVPCEVVSAWVSLSPSKPEKASGCFFPGSHKLGDRPGKSAVHAGKIRSSVHIS